MQALKEPVSAGTPGPSEAVERGHDDGSAPVAGARRTLKVNGLNKQFGSVTAVDGLCLEVRPGEVVGLLGPEAAGNSTTVGKILGLIDRDAGRNEMLGQDLAAHRRVERREVGAIIEQTAWDIG